MQGLQSFVRRHGYLLYNIDVDQDNLWRLSHLFTSRMCKFYFQYMNTEVTVALTTIEWPWRIDTVYVTRSICSGNQFYGKSALEEGYFGLNFELCVCQIFFLHFSDRRSLIFWWWWCDKHYIICNRDYWQETYINT